MQLEGIRVLDLTRLLPGPYATQLLADAHADVIKVEDPHVGDGARYVHPRTEREVGATFDFLNRGKRSVALDLKAAEGKEAFYRLAESADVILEGFRPGVVERLEIDYDSIRERNPAIVYCSLTGYGQDGPYANRAGHDLNYVGVAGMLDMTRRDESEAPRIPGYQVADHAGGLYAAQAILGALLSRELGTGTGEFVDVSMTDVVASFAQTSAHDAFTGNDPRPGETKLTGRYPWYDVYETADGGYVTLAPLEEKFWRQFCAEVDREDLADVHGTDDEAELEALAAELTALFAQRTRDEWIETLSDDAMIAPVLTPAEMVRHPQLTTRGVVRESGEGPARIAPPPATAEPNDDESVPGHGEHSRELLAELGYEESALDELEAEGSIVVGEPI